MTRPTRLPLKDQLFNRAKVAALAAELASVQAEFRADDFVHAVVARFPDLALKERIAWIAECLARHLPGDYRPAVGVILRSLPAPSDPARSDGDFGDFIYAPYAEYVAQRGCTSDDLNFSLAALRGLTMRFSAEDAIRTFINNFPRKHCAPSSSGPTTSTTTSGGCAVREPDRGCPGRAGSTYRRPQRSRSSTSCSSIPPASSPGRWPITSTTSQRRTQTLRSTHWRDGETRRDRAQARWHSSCGTQHGV